MKKLLIALALLLAPTAASAQCNGNFPPNSLCGSVAGGPPGQVSVSSFAFGLVVGVSTIASGVNGDILYDNNGLLGILATTGTGNVVLQNSPTFTGSVTFPDAATWSSSGIVGGVASLSTSVTVPQIYGGTLSGSSLILSSTSNGSPSGDTLALHASSVVVNTINGAGTAILQIGNGDASVLRFTNATSGTISVQPPTGALGTAVLTLPDVTDTFAAIAAAQTFTNKTFTSSTNVLGGVTTTLGSDATGDIYYRNSGGVLTRLGIGSAGQVLEVSTGLPAWATVTGTGTVTGPVSSTNTAIARWSGTAGTALLDSLDTISTGGTIAINPTANSYVQGFNITQSSPTSGSQAGPFSYNLIAINDQSDITGSAGTIQTSGFRVDMTVGGANLGGQPKIAGYFNMIESIPGVSSPADKIGVVGGALIQIAEASTGAGAYGGNFFAGVQSSGSIARLVGAECDIQIASGSSATNRYCYSAVNVGVAQGSTLDSVIFVANIGGTAGAFKSLVTFSNAFGFAPMATTANLFSSDTTFTINDVFHFANAQINGNILNFPNAILSGAGGLTLGNAANSAGGAIAFNGSGSGSFTIQASSAGFPTLIGVPGPAAGTDPMCYNTGNSLVTWATICSSSDRRIKTNFGQAPGLNAVLCMEGITFDLLDADQARRKGRQVGLIAQDVQKCVPEVVSENGSTTITLADGNVEIIDHTLAIDYPRLTAVLINAFHDLTASNDNLKARAKRLKGTIR